MGIRWADRLPLGRLGAGMWLTQKTTDELRDLVESGAILWVWDIASNGAGRRELRLWRPCVDALARGEPQPQDTAEAVLKHVLPDGRPWFTVRELSTRWMCSRHHLIKLIDEKLLETTPESPRRTGAGGSPQITRQSAAAFLQARRVV